MLQTIPSPPTSVLIPTVRLIGRERSVWQLCAIGGYMAGAVGSTAVAFASGNSPGDVAILAAGAAVAFLVVAFVTLLATSEEIYVFFHHGIAVTLTTWLLGSWTGMGRALAMDFAMIGLGLCLAVGRVGCLMVGCCHGRPARIGVVYGKDHVTRGFPPALVGHRLAPVQAIEAVSVLALTGCAIAAIMANASPGVAATLIVTGYATVRFVLEYFRGELSRPAAAGLNHAQWTALAILVVAAISTPQPVTIVALLAISAVATVSVAAWSRRRTAAAAAHQDGGGSSHRVGDGVA